MMKHSRRDFLRQTALFSLAAASGSRMKPTEVFGAQARMHSSELAAYDAVGLAELIKKKQITPLELVEDTIKRIERVNPKLNLVLTKLFDFEKARTRAKLNPGDSALAGVPVLLKNLIEYKDAKIDFGSRLYSG